MTRTTPRLLTLTALLTLAGCAAPYVASEAPPPTAPREFRAAWIATVHNIDWPSEPGLDAETQQQELLALLDLAADVGLNAVVFQIRPACDALYASELEPWSHYLTGVPGQSPGYDPLQFAIEAAHARGLELHAWFNPYRASPSDKEPPPVASHVSHPGSTLHHAVRSYGKLKLLDPGLPEVRAHSLSVILDVVRRYDVDGVHMDDYFYPYPDKLPDGSWVPFPDAATYAERGGGLSLGDWRRENVNAFVRELRGAVHAEASWLKVGIAPFGIWRPKHPPSVEGFDAYEGLAADTRRWLREGWVDYLGPQLYWGTDFPEQPFADLLTWWEAQNPLGRHLWPGISSRWIESTRDPDRDAQEILDQIELTRTSTPASRPGHCHWNLSALQEDRGGIRAALREGSYREQALIPATPWLGDAPPAELEDVAFELTEDGLRLTWAAPASVRWVALWIRADNAWSLQGVRLASAGAWSLTASPAALALRPLSATGVLGAGSSYQRAE